MFIRQIKIIIISLLLSFPAFTFSQSSIKQIDSINSISYNYIISNLRSSLNIFKENLENARKLNYKRGEGIALSNLALITYLLGKYDQSVEYHIQSFDIFIENNMTRELANSYGEFGYQAKRRDMKKANDYMKKGISTALSLENNEGLLAKLYDNYAVIKELEAKYDSAVYYSTKSLEIKFKLNDSIGIPFSLNKIASIYANQKNFKEAFSYLNISDHFRYKKNNPFEIAENKTLRADFHYYQNNLDSALHFYFDALNDARSLTYTYLIAYSLKKISDIYISKQDFKKALEYFQNFSVYNDSLTNLETNSRIAQLEIEFETQQKDKLIALNDLKIQQRNFWLAISLVTILLISTFAFVSLKYQKQKRERTIKELEYQEQIKRAMLEKKMLDEKLRISRELHDNIGSQLTFIISSIDNLIFTQKSDNQLSLNSIKEFSRSALFDLRNTIWAMKEERGDIDKLFLKTNDFIQRLQSADLGINISIHNNLSKHYNLSSIQMLNLFRIIQELIQNSVKHSFAKNINIIFSDANGNLSFLITDDGKGFDVNKQNDGSGLENISKRCEQSNAEFQISSDSNGTSAIITILD